MKSIGNIYMVMVMNCAHADSIKHDSDVPPRLPPISLAIASDLLCVLPSDICHMRNLQQVPTDGRYCSRSLDCCVHPHNHDRPTSKSKCRSTLTELCTGKLRYLLRRLG